MTEPWSRPHGDNRPPGWQTDGAIEIELAGPGGPPSADDGPLPAGGEAPDRPNWRKVVAVASTLGVAVGICVAVVISSLGGEDDEDDTTPNTTIDPEELASIITTPPTLPPVLDPELDPGPTAPTSQTLDLFRDPDEQAIETSGLELPEYEPVERSSTPGRFALTPESMLITGSVVTELTLERAGQFPDVAEVRYDIGRRRLEIVPAGDQAARFIIDIPAEALYNTRDGESWERAPLDEWGQAVGVELDDYIGAIVVGPLRPSTFAAASITPDGFVADRDGETLAAYVVSIPAAELPEWVFFYDVLAAQPDAQRIATFRVLVAADGRLRRVDGLNATVGGGAVLSAHDVLFDVPVSIEPPPPESVSDVSLLGQTESGLTAIPGPDYPRVAASELSWQRVDQVLATFVGTDAVTVTDWRTDGETTIELQRDTTTGGLIAVRTSTRPSEPAYQELVMAPAGGAEHARQEPDGAWYIVDESLPFEFDVAWFDGIIPTDTIRDAIPGTEISLVSIGERTVDRATFTLEPGSFDSAEIGFGAAADSVTTLDVLIDVEGAVVGYLITPLGPFDPFVIEVRFDHDAQPSIDLPAIDS